VDAGCDALTVTCCVRCLAEPVGVAELGGACNACAVRLTLFGIDEQAVFTIGRLPTTPANASDAMLAVRNAIPATAPSAADLRIWGLTSTTSLKLVRQPDRSPSSIVPTLCTACHEAHSVTHSPSRVHRRVTLAPPGKLRGASLGRLLPAEAGFHAARRLPGARHRRRPGLICHSKVRLRTHRSQPLGLAVALPRGSAAGGLTRS
jgi:hypothetical protein